MNGVRTPRDDSYTGGMDNAWLVPLSMLLGGIFGEIVEILYKSGILRIDTAFRQRSRVDLLDLSDLVSNYSKSGQRVSDRSVFYPVVLNDG